MASHSAQAHQPARAAAFLLVVCLTAATGCRPAGPDIAHADRPRDPSPGATASDQAAVSGGNNAFAFGLYQAVRPAEGNLFFSPYSLSTALAMTYAGARGDTERQMAATLHFALPQAQLHPAFNALDLALTGAGQAGPAQAQADFQLRIANAVWAQSNYEFKPDYLGVLAQNYGAGVGLLDFASDGARERARRTINDWVSDQAEGKIKDLMVKRAV